LQLWHHVKAIDLVGIRRLPARKRLDCQASRGEG
jgi:hypothetical protein